VVHTHTYEKNLFGCGIVKHAQVALQFFFRALSVMILYIIYISAIAMILVFNITGTGPS